MNVLVSKNHFRSIVVLQTLGPRLHINLNFLSQFQNNLISIICDMFGLIFILYFSLLFGRVFKSGLLTFSCSGFIVATVHKINSPSTLLNNANIYKKQRYLK